jgi:peptidoglycan hydrolase-like protein with peptidoglycan-binding domain
MSKLLIVDGIFGMATANLVEKFQSKNGLVPDKVVGSKTWAKLLEPKKKVLI